MGSMGTKQVKLASAVQRAASRTAKAEAGKSQAKIGDLRQSMKFLKAQHVAAKRGDPSLLMQLVKEARAEKRKKKLARKKKR